MSSRRHSHFPLRARIEVREDYERRSCDTGFQPVPSAAPRRSARITNVSSFGLRILDLIHRSNFAIQIFCLSLLFLIFAPAQVNAHRTDEYLQDTTFLLEQTQLTAWIRLTPGSATLPDLLPQI